MITVIAEKHDIAKAISDALGNAKREDGYYIVDDYCITYCVGHLLNIEIPNENEVWKWDNLPIKVDGWKFKIKEDTSKQYKIIAGLIKKCNSIIHAGDPDDEGQLIVDEILYNEDIIDLKGNEKKPVKRILINDNNTDVIKKEFTKLKDNKAYLGLSLVALSRKLADVTFGYNLTRAFTLKNQALGNQGVVSVGRVQTPMLALITRRDSEVKNHVKAYYYDITADIMLTEENSLTFKYKANKDEIDDTGNITSETLATSIVERIKNNFDTGIITDYKVEKEEKTPLLPYNLLNLQVDCSKKFKMKPDRVLEITQNLREKYKAITYNRSDCEYLHDDAFNLAPELLKNLKTTAENNKYNEFLILLNKTDTSIKSKAFNSKKTSAHTAIIPTNTVQYSMSEDEKKVYLLIAKRYALQFLPNALYQRHTVTVSYVDDTFVHSSSVCLSRGWQDIYQDEDEEKSVSEKRDYSFLDNLKGSNIQPNEKTSINLKRQETKPKKLYTTATFLTDLKRVADYCKDANIKKLLKDKDKNIAGEHGGIGTPATRSAIIKTLYAREYIIDDPKGFIVSTKLGQNLISSLPENITYPDMTALWHEQLRDVESLDKPIDSFVDSVFTFTEQEVEAVKSKKLNFDSNAIKCPNCDGVLIKKISSNSCFWGCSNYPACKTTFQDKNGKPDIWKTVQCPSCKTGELHKISGKNGFFWKCKNQDCANSFSDKHGKPDFEPKATASDKYKCLECNSKLVRRKGKYGFFWGCSNYPTCKTNYQDKNGEPVYQKTEKK